MIVGYANKQAMSAIDESSTVITTDPHPVGDANYVLVTLLVPVLFTELATATLTYKMQGSNDGQSWFDITSFTDNTTGPLTTPQELGEDVTCAYLRAHITLAGSGGSTTGITSTIFDLHANFTRK